MYKLKNFSIYVREAMFYVETISVSQIAPSGFLVILHSVAGGALNSADAVPLPCVILVNYAKSSLTNRLQVNILVGRQRFGRQSPKMA